MSSSSHAPVKRVSNSQLSSSAISGGALSSSYKDPSNLPFDSDSSFASNDKIAYLLLGQEEYLEHHSEITHCKFTTSGFVIASSDVNGVIKVWSPSPSGAPQTLSTFITQSSITALDWIPNSERHFLYGTQNGIVRLCDSNERRTNKEMTFDQVTRKIATCIKISFRTDLYILSAQGFGIRGIACSPNANSCILGLTNSSGRSSLLLYDIRTMKQEQDLSSVSAPDHQSPMPELTACVFNHNSQMSVVGGSDGKIRIFDLRRKECISSWSVDDDGGIRTIISLAMSPDETAIYSLAQDGHFCSWSMFKSGEKQFDYYLEDPYFSQHPNYPRTAWSNQV